MTIISLNEARRRWQSDRWPNFSPAEFACPCCGELWWSPTDFDCAQRLRHALAHPVRFNSTHRCRRHNARVGGAPRSQHKKIAFDFPLTPAVSSQIEQLQVLMVRAGFLTFGLYASFIHMDRRPGRFWITGGGRRWAAYFRRWRAGIDPAPNQSVTDLTLPQGEGNHSPLEGESANQGRSPPMRRWGEKSQKETQ